MIRTAGRIDSLRVGNAFRRAGDNHLLTLLVINGGDSTNEEMMHFSGFAATKRGWNGLVFEGPWQWSALQLNPRLFLSVDYEKPVLSRQRP